MTWEQRYRLRRSISTSLVLWAGLSLLAALLAAPIIRWLDRETGWIIFGFSPDGARAILGTLTGSMLTFIVFVLSATLIVVQLASGQLTPRIIAMVFAMPWVRISLGIFTFTYVYTLSALGRVEERVPDLHVSMAVLLNLTCIVVFFLFVQRLSNGLRPSTMMKSVADRGREVIEQVYPAAYDPNRPEQAISGALPALRREWSSSRVEPGLSWRSAWRNWFVSPGMRRRWSSYCRRLEIPSPLATRCSVSIGGAQAVSPTRSAGVRRGRPRTDPGPRSPVCVPHSCRYRQQGRSLRR